MGLRKVNRDILIEKAAHFFRTRGFEGTTMQTIADALKINKASLYHHIADKETLAVTVLQTIHRFFQTQFFALAYDESFAPRNRLEKMAIQLEQYFLNCEGGCLMANFTLELGTRFPRFSTIIRTYFEDWTHALASLFKTCHFEDVAQDLAEQAVARFQGALIHYRLGQKELLLKQKKYWLEAFDRGKEKGSNQAHGVVVSEAYPI